MEEKETKRQRDYKDLRDKLLVRKDCYSAVEQRWKDSQLIERE